MRVTEATPEVARNSLILSDTHNTELHAKILIDWPGWKNGDPVSPRRPSIRDHLSSIRLRSAQDRTHGMIRCDARRTAICHRGRVQKITAILRPKAEQKVTWFSEAIDRCDSLGVRRF
jgi:hypothetical protein